jgi:D-tyrosyl-tRNA(Tyr) deacylase
MRIVLQRVKDASLSILGQEKVYIGPGLVALVGFGREDGPNLPQDPVWSKLLDKIVSLRIFPDHKGRSELSLNQVRGEILVVSQFTLYADWRKGRRPSFTPAAPPERAKALYDQFINDLSSRTAGPVASGRFGAEMDILLCNWGPFTLTLDSQE